MIAAVQLLAGLALFIWVTWIFYGQVMNLMRARDAGTLTTAQKVLGYPCLYVGLALDAAMNLVLCTVLFLELPREVLVTARISRLKAGDGWRAAVASWVCTQLLDSLDPSGCHCK